MVKVKGNFEKALREMIGDDRVLLQEPMKNHTTFCVGGPAEFYIIPLEEQVKEVIKLCQEYDIPFLLIGNGSNLLVSDKGIGGAVIEIGKDIGKIRVEEERVYAQAGALLSKTAFAAMKAGLEGMEFLAGIPGCVGGAVVMNAGAYGGEIKDIIKSVTVLTRKGVMKKISAEELELSYRHSNIIQNDYIVLETEFLLKKGDAEQIRERMDQLKERRLEKQPLEYPSAGSTFKRPKGYFAGKLIMDAGLRGFQIGGAAVSSKHCGFVINKESATATDIHCLIREIQKEVQKQFGVRLEPEVKMVGDFT
ncbi:MAG: UDP-N-acetylmuramate dehydrogenase [Lachnospiraceae bacterium]|nr:UDP-N-acetylmuramate dehydrogenase [Lachnospiraceae bacterium]